MGQMNLSYFNAMSQCEHVTALKNKFFLYSYTCFYTYFEKKQQRGSNRFSVKKKKKKGGGVERKCQNMLQLSNEPINKKS